MKIVLALALLGVATAFCPNACSGHGTCKASPKDSCQCFTRREQEFDTNQNEVAWTGADCSLRKLVLSRPLCWGGGSAGACGWAFPVSRGYF